MIMNKLEKAVNILNQKEYSFVLYKNEADIKCDIGIGLKPIMAVLREDRRGFEQAVIADKVIGKAAALMAVLGGAQAVHGALMSKTAIRVFETFKIPYTNEVVVPIIENRTQTGMCPLEQAVQDIEDLEEAYNAIEATIAELMKNK